MRDIYILTGVLSYVQGLVAWRSFLVSDLALVKLVPCVSDAYVITWCSNTSIKCSLLNLASHLSIHMRIVKLISPIVSNVGLIGLGVTYTPRDSKFVVG